MMEFLTGEALASNLSDTLAKSQGADIAVAYWGAGAISTLRLDEVDGPIRILCDAYSGACNPYELQKLLSFKNVTIRYRNGLHTKVYITSNQAVVGSANASANGLGKEGNPPDNVEAALVIAEDLGQLSKVSHWFGSIWQDGIDLLEENIPEILLRWKAKRRADTNSSIENTILGQMRSDPDWFKGRGISLMFAPLAVHSTDAVEKYEDLKNKKFSSNDIKYYERRGVPPFYELSERDEMSAGDYILDFEITVDYSAVYHGLWQVRLHDGVQKAGSSWIAWCDKCRDFKGLKMSQADGKRLGKELVRFSRSHDLKPDQTGSLIFRPLDEVAHLLFREQVNG